MPRSPCQAAPPQPAGQCRHLQLGAGCLPRPPAHIEGDSSGITNLGRFKESESILALAGLWELNRFPQWNSHLLFPHVWATGDEGVWERERQVWEEQGSRNRVGEPDTGGGEPCCLQAPLLFHPHLHILQSQWAEPTALMASKAQRGRVRART